MGYPVAYRSAAQEYGGAGFQKPLPLEAVPVPGPSIPQVRPSEGLPTRTVGPTAIGSGVATALRLGSIILRNSRVRPILQAASILTHLSPDGFKRPEAVTGTECGNVRYNVGGTFYTFACYANGWRYVCGQPPWFNTMCGPYNVYPAVSCTLTGQAAGPTPCDAGAAGVLSPAVNDYSVVWDYPYFASYARYYGLRFHREAGATEDPAMLPQLTKSTRLRLGYADTVEHPLLQPLHWPKALPKTDLFKPVRNDEWHQVGPQAATDGARVPSLPYFPRTPVPAGTKERKLNKAGAVAAARLAAGVVTESDDFVRSIWMAIPYKDRTNPKCKHNDKTNQTVCPWDADWSSAKSNPAYHYVNQRVDTMLEDIYNNWDSIDWTKAITNQHEQDSTDFIVGKGAGETTRNFSGSPYTGGAGFRGFWGPAM